MCISLVSRHSRFFNVALKNRECLGTRLMCIASQLHVLFCSKFNPFWDSEKLNSNYHCRLSIQCSPKHTYGMSAQQAFSADISYLMWKWCEYKCFDVFISPAPNHALLSCLGLFLGRTLTAILTSIEVN